MDLWALAAQWVRARFSCGIECWCGAVGALCRKRLKVRGPRIDRSRRCTYTVDKFYGSVILHTKLSETNHIVYFRALALDITTLIGL